MSAIKFPMRWLGLSLVIGSGFAYYRVNQINKTLGVDILEHSLKILREDLEADNREFNQDNKLHYFIEEASNQFEIAKKRLEVYFARLMNVGRYELICRDINQIVTMPLIANYEQAKMFQFADIIQQFKEKGEFNNKMASQLAKIRQQNGKIKNQNKLLLQNLYNLQQQLLTTHMHELNQQSKRKIDIIYSYFRQREKFLSRLLNKQSKASQSSGNGGEEWIDELNYGFKIQYI